MTLSILLLTAALGQHHGDAVGAGYNVHKSNEHAKMRGDVSSAKKIWDMSISKGIATYPDVTCPADFELIAGSCYHVQQELPEATCDKDAELRDNLCLVRSAGPAEMDCADGFELVGKTCKRAEVVAPTPECVKGELFNDECVTENTIKPSTLCMKGSTYRDGGCVVIEEYKANAICDPDYFLQGKECVRLTYYNSFFGCLKKSMQLEGDQCIERDYKALDYYCAKGYKLAEDNECWAKVISHPLVSCINGDLEGGKCVVKTTGEIMKKCKVGYQYDAVGDICVHYEKPERYCPKDHVYEDGVCVTKKIHESLKVCPSGTEFEGNKCVSVDIQEPEFKCPDKYELEQGQCVLTNVKKAEMMCPKGTLLKADGHCIKEEATKPAPECEVGVYDDNKKKCLVESANTPMIECPDKYEIQPDGQCLKIHTIKPDLMCPKQFKLELNGCTREFVAKPSYLCAADEELHGKNCVKELLFPPTLQCKSKAIFADGFCNEAIVQKAVKACPKDRKYDTKDGMCHLMKAPKASKEPKKEHKDEEKKVVHKGDKLQMKTEMKLKAAVESAVKKASKKASVESFKAKVDDHKVMKGGKKEDHHSTKPYFKVPKDKPSKASKIAKVRPEKNAEKYGAKITDKKRKEPKDNMRKHH